MNKIIQTCTGKKFSLIEVAKTDPDWLKQMPTDKHDDIFISELPGTINGSLFCYWIGDKDINSLDVQASIQEHINTQDVVGVRFMRDIPSRVHPGLM